MIYAIQGSQRQQHKDMLDSMHRLRARVFGDRLGWDVEVKNGREIDRFDDCNPLYLISTDGVTNQVRGSLRLLPTTGPNMLRDVFNELLPQGECVESPTIWESSRFSIELDLDTHHVGRLSVVTTELLCGIVEVGLLAGLSLVVSVFDARMLRIFRAANCLADIIGKPVKIGRVMTYAGLFEIAQHTWDNIAAAGNISAPVLAGVNATERAAA